jgi:integrase
LRVRKAKGGKERVLPLSPRLLKELVAYWRAQRQGQWGQEIPWLFLGYQAEPLCPTSGQNIYYRAVKKSGVRYKGGIHTLRHYPGFRTIPSRYSPSPLCKDSGWKNSA